MSGEAWAYVGAIVASLVVAVWRLGRWLRDCIEPGL